VKTPNLHDWRPSEGEAKDVQATSMLDTTADESVDMNESNDVGKELVVSHPDFGELGAKGRN